MSKFAMQRFVTVTHAISFNDVNLVTLSRVLAEMETAGLPADAGRWELSCDGSDALLNEVNDAPETYGRAITKLFGIPVVWSVNGPNRLVWESAPKLLSPTQTPPFVEARSEQTA